MAKITPEEFIASLKEMTILEIKALIDAMKNEFGIDPSAVAAAPAQAAAAEEDQGPKEYDVVLTSCGQSKVSVIKVVREITGLGLIDAKKLVDEAPKAIKEKVKEDEAKELQKKLQEAGATVDLK
ncbi:MAG TPA: 50S ribosomal protein L7/L12 [Bacillota bacterium]|nr:50S ribosomal protein L7/L12 [Bacillota bacterium]HPJ86443.1 50S ribosomal protein L7/L12 [Bacillota bacterium]HRX92455.1 50S ribosomal protein L7/L12 [Candidatus Izemoplasmatales bacterium]